MFVKLVAINADNGLKNIILIANYLYMHDALICQGYAP